VLSEKGFSADWVLPEKGLSVAQALLVDFGLLYLLMAFEVADFPARE